ncbi:MAG: TSUP family transporter [Rhodobacteraceae bacterium]|nr:TSUP family transporter [Paracoccaceae bacterium]
MTDPAILALVALAFLIAGTVKGAAGMGLPTTAVSLMTLALDPRTAIALVLVPMIASNAWQVWRSGEILRACRTHLPFALTLMLGVAVTLMLSGDASDRVLLATLGAALLIFVAVNLARWAPHVPVWADRPAQVFAGLLAGGMGGLTAVWAPPLAIYLAARRVGKDEFIRASGLLILLGSLPLALGYLGQGFLTGGTLAMSLLLLGPTFVGFAIGERIRRGLSETGFARTLMVIFALMGLNLLRRALT